MSSERKYYPGYLRLWHWLNAICLSGILLTVILRKTFLSWRANAKILEEKALSLGVQLPDGLAPELAKALRDNMWEWHHYFGIALALVFLIRIYGFIFDKSNCQCPIKSLKNIAQAQTKEEKKEILRATFQRLLYHVFYVCLTLLILSGATMLFGPKLGLISNETVHTLKEFHEAILPVIVAFIVIHIIGVIIGELTHQKGAVSDMINGGKKD